MKKYLLLITYIFYVAAVFSQTITSELNVKVKTPILFGSTKEDRMPYVLDIEQKIFVGNFNEDTLNVYLKNNNESFLNAYLKGIDAYDLQVIRKNIKGEFDTITMDDFNGRYLTISGIHSNSEFILRYKFAGKISFFLFRNVMLFFYPCMPDDFSWYFENDNMKLQSIKIDIPKNHTIFSDFPFRGEKIINEKENTFFLINDDFYHKDEFVLDSLCIGLYFMKPFIINIDTTGITLNDIDTIQVKAKIEMVKNYILNINSFFGFNNKSNINIVETLWGNGTSVNARVFHTSKNNSFVILDTLMWKKGLQHELIHTLDPLNNIYPKDSTKFFLSESLIEFLSLYFENSNNIYNIDSSFKDFDITKYKVSLFDINSNVYNDDLIYIKTPYLIHLFAKSIGYDLFIRKLKQFYAEAIRDKEVSFERFKIIFNTAETKNQWNCFEKNL